MSCIKNCTKNNIYVAIVLLLLRARQKNRVKTAASSKQKNLTEVNGESSLFFRLCAIKKNNIVLIGGSQGFARCAQILLDTKIGGATAIQKKWVK